MKEINSYMHFDGDARAAMTFYQRCLGGELELMTYAQAMPDAAPESKERIIHAHLATGPVVLMASDVPAGMPLQQGNNVYQNIACESREELDRLFAALGDGGTVLMAPHDAFWGAYFGMLRDRFGTHWMFNHELAGVAA